MIEKLNKKKSNKNSIVRVVISNFNNKVIKEIKVLYTKQGGMDTFIINKMNYDNKTKEIIFEEIENESKYIDINKINDREFEVIKKDKYTDKIIREYKIFGEFKWTKNKGKLLKISVQDTFCENQKIDETKRRVNVSSTERLLLKEKLIKNYSEIAQCKEEEIDSQKIYKIKRFLSYRSNMLIYFNFINDFLVKGTDLDEIWKFQNKSTEEIEGTITKMANVLKSCSHKFIENHNNYAEKQNKKIDEKGWRGKEKIKELKILEDEKINSDLEKILRIFSELRHKMMHYDYKYFEQLFTGENIDISVGNENRALNDLLDLNMFREMLKITEIKEEKTTNYLEDDTEIRLLGKAKKAKKYYTLYNKICNRKNGFNNFINSIFTTDGEENKEVKQVIENKFNERMKFLEDAITTKEIKGKKLKKSSLDGMEKELKEMKKIIELVGAPYIWDIHLNKKYKNLYNKRKNIVEKQSQLIEVGRNKTNKETITTNNEKLLHLKNQMEEITKLNSKFRLQTKLQIAYGLLHKEYNFNLKSFGDKFEVSKEKEIKRFHKNWLNYLDDYIQKDEKFDLNILEKNVKKIRKFEGNFLSNDRSNNLVKLYILIYLLIPVELRGDFLGFVKKNYYDMKNVDSLSEDVETKDRFFHNLRLFEKNSKKFEIISYEMVDYNNFREDFNKVYQSLGIDTSEISVVQSVGIKEKRIFDKNIILPMMKYYQNIFKFINDVEIHALFKYVDREKITFEEGIKRIIKKGDFFEFSSLMKRVKDVKSFKGNESEIYGVRNDIAHINYSNLFLNPLIGAPLLNDPKEKELFKSEKLSSSSLSERVDNFIEEVENTGLDQVDLGMNFINDYYMKKEQFLFNLKETEKENITSSERKKKIGEEENILKRYNLNKNKLSDILKKYKEIVFSLEENKEISEKLWNEIGDLSIFLEDKKKEKIRGFNSSKKKEYVDRVKGLLNKESSQLLGVYKKYVIQNIKHKLIDIFIEGERRFVKLEIFHDKYLEKDEYLFQLKHVLEKKSSNEFVLEKLYINKKEIKEIKELEDMKLEIKGNEFRINYGEQTQIKLNISSKYIQKRRLPLKK